MWYYFLRRKPINILYKFLLVLTINLVIKELKVRCRSVTTIYYVLWLKKIIFRRQEDVLLTVLIFFIIIRRTYLRFRDRDVSFWCKRPWRTFGVRSWRHQGRVRPTPPVTCNGDRSTSTHGRNLIRACSNNNPQFTCLENASSDDS